MKKKIVIESKTGLHARPATEISKVAMQYPCDIYLLVNGKKVNAKSPLMMMAAGITFQTEVEICCEGEAEEMALEKMEKVFAEQMGE